MKLDQRVWVFLVLLTGNAIAQTGAPPDSAGAAPQRGLPPEAVAACQGRAAAAACNFVDREGRALTGVCVAAGPRGSENSAATTASAAAKQTLLCRPERGGPPGGGPAR